MAWLHPQEVGLLKPKTTIMSGIMAFMVLTGFALLATANEFENSDLSDQELAEGIEGYGVSEEETEEETEDPPGEEEDTSEDGCRPPRKRLPRGDTDLSEMKDLFENRSFDREDFNLSRFKEIMENRTLRREDINLTELREMKDTSTFEKDRTLPEGEERDGTHQPGRRVRMRHHFREQNDPAPEAEA